MKASRKVDAIYDAASAEASGQTKVSSPHSICAAGPPDEEARQTDAILTGSSPATQPASLLLEVCVPFRMLNGKVHLEAQAYQGVQRWLDNFDRMTLCAVVVPDPHVDPTMEWIPADELLRGRLAVQLLPWAFRIRDYFAELPRVRRTFQSLIAQHTHLCFSTLGWLGAWGSVGCQEAHGLGRRYAVWLDWVLHQMPPRRSSNPAKYAWLRLQSSMLKHHSLRDIRRSALGLCNGKSVYDGYAQYCSVPKVAHNIHLGTKDIVSSARIQKRLADTRRPMHIVCVGRVHEMKGPRHWLDAIQRLVLDWRGAREIRATWLGAGPLLEEMRQAVAARKLSQYVSFPGHEMSRERLLETLRDAHVFAFCNLTPESPRSLIEALMCGLPIVGFENAFATHLLGAHLAGGAFVHMGDSAALARALGNCLGDPQRLRGMTEAAVAAGTGFSEENVFKHRSDLIKEFL